MNWTSLLRDWKITKKPVVPQISTPTLSPIPSLTATAPQPPAAPEPIMANKFISFLDKVGADAELILSDVVKYLPLASSVAAFIFPPAVAPLAAATTVADLLQTAIADAEQKLAAASLTKATGTVKLATVLTIVTSAVTGLLSDATVAAELKKAGITVDTAYITNLVNAVVAYLNVQGVVVTTADPTPAPAVAAPAAVAPAAPSVTA